MQQLSKLSSFIDTYHCVMYFLMIRPQKKEGQTDSGDEEQPCRWATKS